ncbi:hypothetical protein BABINDRAFT_162369 [Babjeviella inositovora NRRL Y-12698]|uniref:Enoyl reductase (ER) domain-containing protein n=1 Tax=Babjeviella inositovora NRRL Y-12698 TaxID=984486 RepID=A0A1E3QLU5_9ASCO|nr:uncharacterized protein BABINDRAFT_162369 [Babjeviella inositovora NRRL Y-12698]ODQ78663.1 hypothetical protein BABINDRAFT_162369 [Babjeviella inositovora NRRL Y-12698]
MSVRFETPHLTFRAITYKNCNEPFQITEETITLTKTSNEGYTVGDDELLVEVHAAALNPVDLYLYNSSYWIFGNKPKGLGRDYCGVAVKVGSNLSAKFSVGDRVAGVYTRPFGPGTVSEYVLINHKKFGSTLRVPPGVLLTDVELAAWPLVFSTAAEALEVHRGSKPIGKDSVVLVIGGATAVGQNLIQLAKNHYQVKKIVSVNSASSNAFVTGLGADYTIDYTVHQNLLKPTLEIIKTELEGEKFDFIMDTVGGSDYFSDINLVLKPRKEGSGYATIVGDQKSNYVSANIFKVLTFFGIFARIISSALGWGFKYSYFLLTPSEKYTSWAMDMFEEKKLKVTVDSCYAFEDHQSALARLSSNRAQGKIVIKVKKSL